jgi:flagellar basal-body rod protein FlgB
VGERKFTIGIRSALVFRVPDIFSGLTQLHTALDYHLERHNVLASNVAHVDTPGFRPNDLARVDPSDFARVLNVALERTAPNHLGSPSDNRMSQVGRVFQDPTAGAGNDGNYVSLDREAAKLAANHIRYDVVAQLTASELKGLAWAANDGKG